MLRNLIYILLQPDRYQTPVSYTHLKSELKWQYNKQRAAFFAGQIVGHYNRIAGTLFPGDVINIPAGVKHWHGAAYTHAVC